MSATLSPWPARSWPIASFVCWLGACTGNISGPPAPTSAEDDKTTGVPLNCDKPDVDPAPLRRLTRQQYDNTVRDLLGVAGHPSEALTPDEKVAAFDSNAVSPVNRLVVEQYTEVAEELATSAVANVDSLVACDRAGLGDLACAKAFIERFGARAFRRPLAATEVQRYEQLFTENAATFSDGIRRIVAAMLQSPNFLYHLELLPSAGSQVLPLDGYQLASRLSYALWNSMPDESLFEAAAGGKLSSVEGLRAEAERMLNDARAEDAIASFHLQWLGLDGLEDVRKDPALFPAFDANLQSAMGRETTRFADYVIRRGDGRLETLLTAPFSILEGPLYDFYGVLPSANPDEPVALNPAERAGLLTQPAFLSTHAHSNQTSPVHRGLAVRKHLLCTTLPDPPPNVNNNPPDPSPNATTRERFAEHTSDPTCAKCHELIDPIGFGFENYDAVGRFRTEENGLPINAAGSLVKADGASGPFTGVVELAHKLAVSDKVRDCVTRQWFRFSLGRIEGKSDACSMESLKKHFIASDYDVRELLITLVTSDAFRYRRGETP